MPQMAFSHGPIVTTLTMTFMSALPREVNLDPHRVSAWNMLLAAEEAALKKDTGTSSKYRNELVGVRILGFFLLDFYKHSYHQIGLIPYQRLLKEVISCFRVSVNDNEAIFMAIYQLGLSYRNHLIRACE